MSGLISFERCQSSCKEHETNQNYKTKNLLIVGIEHSHGTVSSLRVNRLNHTVNKDCYEWRNYMAM